MAADISLFPLLTSDMLAKVRFQASKYNFYYTTNDHKIYLNEEEIDGSILIYKLVDNTGVWSFDEFNLCIERNYSLRTYQSLFGKEGITCKNSILGLAMRWSSSDSKQRGIIEIGEIKNTDNDIYLDLKHEFSRGQLRGDIEFETILYIKSVGIPSHHEKHLANISGCILGELDKFVIRLDGSGSSFPIYNVCKPNQPLWYIKCDWVDPTYDQFSECVSISINNAHKNYKYLDINNKSYDEQLIKEIMTNAVSIIITKLKEDESYWDATFVGKDLENGSVSQAINYFIKTLEWDVSSPEILSYSIQNYFDKRM